MGKEFDILNLLRLQLLENKITQKVVQMEALIKNEGLVGLNKECNQAKEILDKYNQDYNDLESKRKKIDDTIKTNQDKIKSNQEKLFSGTVGSSKELLNYQEEIKMLEQHNSKLEDDEIGLMMQIDNMDKDLKQAKEKASKLEEELNKSKENISQKAKEIEGQIKVLKEKRDDVISTIPKDHLDEYNKVKQKKGGIAVTVLKDRFCSVCNMEIPVADAEHINDPNKVYRCPLCGRLSVIYTEDVGKVRQEMEE